MFNTTFGLAPLVMIAAVLALAYFLWFCYQPASWTKTVVKTGSVGLLALAAWLASAPLMLVVALALCALGDYFLSRDTEATFLAGVGAFAAGHLAYAWLFHDHPLAETGVLTQGTRLIAIFALAGLGVAMAVILFRKAGRLRWAVMAYIPIILGMAVAAMTLPQLGPLILVLPAALLFVASDFVLSLEMFVLDARHPARRVTPFLVWSWYWLAQFGFFLGLAGLAMK